MLDRESVSVDSFFAEVLQSVEEVEAGSHVVHVACFERFAELNVSWKSSFLALPVEGHPEALKWVLLLDAVGHAGEDLVEAAGLEVAYAATEHVALQEFDRLDELSQRESLGTVVAVVEGENDGCGDFDERTESVEGGLEVG